MNSKVIHESERAGGMGGAPRRRLRTWRAKACKSWYEMVHISWDIQLSGTSQKKNTQRRHIWFISWDMQLSGNSHLGVTGWFSHHWKFNCWVFWVFWICLLWVFFFWLLPDNWITHEMWTISDQDLHALALLSFLLRAPPMPPALSDSCVTLEFISVPY